MVTHSMRRRRYGWRVFTGLFLLGLLIVASAANAGTLQESLAGSNSSAAPFMQ